MSDVAINLFSFTKKTRCTIYGCLEETYNFNGVCDSIHFWTNDCKECQSRYTFRYTPGIDYTYCDDCRPKPNIFKRLINYLFNN